MEHVALKYGLPYPHFFENLKIHDAKQARMDVLYYFFRECMTVNEMFLQAAIRDGQVLPVVQVL